MYRIVRVRSTHTVYRQIQVYSFPRLSLLHSTLNLLFPFCFFKNLSDYKLSVYTSQSYAYAMSRPVNNTVTKFRSMGKTEEMAQYLRRDCLEISGVKPNTEYSSENIVESIGKVLNVNVTDADISIAHPLPSYKKDALPKLIVKFTRRNVRNEFYAKRKVLAGKNLQADPVLKKFIVGKNIYISESLTPQRKKLYGDINKFRKEIMWKYIWSHNGRIYLKKNETVTNHQIGRAHV